MVKLRSEKAYETYAWLFLFVAGLAVSIIGVFITVVPSPIDTAGVKNLTGMTWEQIVSQSPAAAKLTSYFVGQFGIAETGFSTLVMGVSATG